MGKRKRKRKDHGNGQGKGKNGREGGREGGRKDGFKYLINIVSDNIPSVLGNAAGCQGVSSQRCEN